MRERLRMLEGKTKASSPKQSSIPSAPSAHRENGAGLGSLQSSRAASPGAFGSFVDVASPSSGPVLPHVAYASPDTTTELLNDVYHFSPAIHRNWAADDPLQSSVFSESLNYGAVCLPQIYSDWPAAEAQEAFNESLFDVSLYFPECWAGENNATNRSNLFDTRFDSSYSLFGARTEAETWYG